MPSKIAIGDESQTDWSWLLLSNVLGNRGTWKYLSVGVLVRTVSSINTQYKRASRKLRRCKSAQDAYNRNLSVGLSMFKSIGGRPMKPCAAFPLFAMAADAHIVRTQRRSRSVIINRRRRHLLRDIRRGKAGNCVRACVKRAKRTGKNSTA